MQKPMLISKITVLPIIFCTTVINNHIPIVVRQLFLVIYPYLKVVVLLPICLNILYTNVFMSKVKFDGNDVTVNISNLGVIRGFVERTATTQRPFLSFTGIPYGTIPIRFAPSVIKEPLIIGGKFGENVFDATLPQKACIQPTLLPFLPGDFTEDCLTLNIYTPTKDVRKNEQVFPVIIFIHGGSFFRWSANMFNGRRFLEQDVVLVTINYRLNIFGFLCFENDDAPGNLGLFDQILALQWVQKYIVYFGGDNSRVSIAGQSAGGAAVTYLLDSPLAKDLFHGVIASSGDSSSGWAVEHNALRNSLSAANALGCANGTSPNQDLQIVLKCMRSLPPHKILDGLPVFFSSPVEQGFHLSKVPKIVPRRKTTGHRFNSHVPLMVGINRHDGSFLLSRIYTSFLVAKNRHNDSHYLRNYFVSELLTSSHFGFIDSPNGTINALAREFLGDTLDSGDFKAMASGLTEIYSKFYFTKAAHQTAIAQSETSDVYFYSFNYEGKQSLYPYTGGVPQVQKGIAHGDDLMYLFDFGEFTTKEEERVSTMIVKYWVNFASTGNPNKRTLHEPSEVEFWPKFCKNFQIFLKIDSKPAISAFV